ncbi:MAG: hypothetical protein MI700_08540 [Balneolales bacterium]|nr:hypothetical protein [Balneolales bacterium]
MSKLLNISPVLPVKSMEEEMKFFAELGFRNVYDSTNYTDTLDYAVVYRAEQAIHLQLFGDHKFEGQQIKIWVQNVNDFASEFDSKNIDYNRRNNTPWETHELGIYSPSGHAIFFVQDLNNS